MWATILVTFQFTLILLFLKLYFLTPNFLKYLYSVQQCFEYYTRLKNFLSNGYFNLIVSSV